MSSYRSKWLTVPPKKPGKVTDLGSNAAKCLGGAWFPSTSELRLSAGGPDDEEVRDSDPPRRKHASDLNDTPAAPDSSSGSKKAPARKPAKRGGSFSNRLHAVWKGGPLTLSPTASASGVGFTVGYDYLPEKGRATLRVGRDVKDIPLWGGATATMRTGWVLASTRKSRDSLEMDVASVAVRKTGLWALSSVQSQVAVHPARQNMTWSSNVMGTLKWLHVGANLNVKGKPGKAGATPSATFGCGSLSQIGEASVTWSVPDDKVVSSMCVFLQPALAVAAQWTSTTCTPRRSDTRQHDDEQFNPQSFIAPATTTLQHFAQDLSLGIHWEFLRDAALNLRVRPLRDVSLGCSFKHPAWTLHAGLHCHPWLPTESPMALFSAGVHLAVSPQ